MILFLDFDGVLHPFPKPENPTQLFVNRGRLECVLFDYPRTEVVISSTWRENYSLTELKALFSPSIRNRIVGVLPVIQIHTLADMEAIRFKEIQLFLSGSEKPWLALDDDADLFPASCPNLIHCEDGFGKKEESKLRAALAITGGF